MADVRSLLRAERANRRITHPHATYTSDGKLHCNLCESVVKSEAAWQAHLHSTAHTLRASRKQEVAAARGSGGDTSGKKRKAASLDSPSPVDERKRVKGAAEIGGEAGEEEVGAVEEKEEEPDDTAQAPPQDSATAANGPTPASTSVDEAELAAFERELAELESTSAAPTTALGSGTVISAAPVTAEELAAQAREEQSAQRGQRDAEIEAEREEAEEALRGELEEMEGYEERARKLRGRREALRKERRNEEEVEIARLADGAVREVAGNAKDVVPDVGEEESEEDEDEEYDDWGFGGR